MSRHEEASALLASVRDVIGERAEGVVPPSWCVRRGWDAFLAGLPEGAVVAAERDGLAARVASFDGAPADLVALAQAVQRVTDLPPAAGARVALSRVDARRASNRKRAQVAAFAALLAGMKQPARIVDVGSGHGHLTRHLASVAGVPAEGWDRDPARVAVAAALTADGRVRFVAQDWPDVVQVLGSNDLVVGLHACGVLGDLAVRAARDAGAAVALVGCCPQKRTGDRPPLVVPPGIPEAALTIPHAALGLANARTGENGIEADLATRTRARRQRLALLHALQAAGVTVAPGEELRGVNRRQATHELADLAARAFQARGLSPPTPSMLDAAVRAADPEFERARRWELPRAMVGRLVEVWIALDRGALLGDRACEVVIAFDESASPRNVALLSGRPS